MEDIIIKSTPGCIRCAPPASADFPSFLILSRLWMTGKGSLYPHNMAFSHDTLQQDFIFDCLLHTKTVGGCYFFSLSIQHLEKKKPTCSVRINFMRFWSWKNWSEMGNPPPKKKKCVIHSWLCQAALKAGTSCSVVTFPLCFEVTCLRVVESFCFLLFLEKSFSWLLSKATYVLFHLSEGVGLGVCESKNVVYA